MSELLVSVRSAEEAMAALVGGAGLIDIKEPARGPLGRADDGTIDWIVRAVAGRRPVSAALGEWTDGGDEPSDAKLTYIKWGLAGCARSPRWKEAFDQRLRHTQAPQCVLVAYADYECAQAPPVEEVFQVAERFPGSVLLVDTHCKDARNPFHKSRPTLLDWLSAVEVINLCARCRHANVKIALAGSLGLAELRELSDARPDWFAVRGAVCDGDRHGTVHADKVREFREFLSAS